MTDIRFENHGSIWLMTGATEAGREWIEEMVDYQLTWGRGIAVEPRYVEAIAQGAVDAGLEVE